jgi:hypothetical protein
MQLVVPKDYHHRQYQKGNYRPNHTKQCDIAEILHKISLLEVVACSEYDGWQDEHEKC